ncbi:MAG: YoaK family protein [Erysipelotrichaceae bacterium]|nr:YoaK family protein [Erysipelotrichaceae bacterium]
MQNTKQHSDSLFIGIILFFIGGFQNVYTYLNCGKIFANLQTGNMMWMAVALAEKDILGAARYLIPLGSFCLGCVIGALVDTKCKYNFKMHWRTIVLIIKMIITIIASLLAALITFNSALSLQGFKNVCNRSLPAMMMIGNLRKAVDHLTKYSINHDKEDLKEGMLIWMLLFTFIFGAYISAILSDYFMNNTILFIIPLYLMMVIYLQNDSKC